MNSLTIYNETSIVTNQSEYAPQINDFLEASLSQNTREAYMYDLAHFRRWGGTLPATPEQIIEYLAHYAKLLNTRTLERHLRTLRYWHKVKDFQDPTEHKTVKAVIKGIKNIEGKPYKKAMALTQDDLLVIDAGLTKQDTLIAARDNALIQLGFFGAFRRSELITLKVEDLCLTNDGLLITIRRSKTDQEGLGATCAIPYMKGPLCPIRALQRWLTAANITSGYIFIGFTNTYELLTKPILGKQVSYIIRKLVKQFNLGDPNVYSSHSMRRGFATGATRKGASLLSIMRHGRWSDASTVAGYIEEGSRFADNAVASFNL